jgi:hypothetical protein
VGVGDEAELGHGGSGGGLERDSSAASDRIWGLEEEERRRTERRSRQAKERDFSFFFDVRREGF